MSPQIFPQIRMVILSLLDESGGMYKGTLRLAELIPADQHAVIRSLPGCQRDGLVRSIHTHGGRGRGHMTTHRLTSQGRYVLTQKGKDYVKSE